MSSTASTSSGRQSSTTTARVRAGDAAAMRATRRLRGRVGDGSELPVPLDVPLHASLEIEPWRISQQALGLGARQRAAFRHEAIAFHSLDMCAREVLVDDVNELGD